MGQDPHSVAIAKGAVLVGLNRLINRDIWGFECGDDHIVLLNSRSQAFGMGKNQFGQLGIPQENAHRDVITPILQSFSIQKVFCTPFCTFFLTGTHRPIQPADNSTAVGSTAAGNSDSDTPSKKL